MLIAYMLCNSTGDMYKIQVDNYDHAEVEAKERGCELFDVKRIDQEF